MSRKFFSACLSTLVATGAFAADDSAQESRFITNARQLIYEGKRSGEGYFSPDGKFLVFQSEREADNPFYQIYLLDLESGDTHRVSPGVGKTTCAFIQPGTGRILYASTHHDPEAKAKQKAELDFRASGKERRYSWDYDETFDIFTANPDGSDIRQLTKERGYDAEASFSPDGKKIVFSSTRAIYEKGDLSPEDRSRLEKDPAYYGDIYIMDADGSNVRRLTTAPGYDGGPFFSPDGQRIIWRRFDEHGMIAEVYTMRTDGTDVQRVTEFKSMSWAPYYHPSQEYIVFTTNKLGFENFELFIVDRDGKKEPVRVTYTPGFDGLPVFSPDGKKLCWTTNRTPDKKSQLFFADWNHEAALAALAAAPARNTAAAPAPASNSPAKQPATTASSPSTLKAELSPEITADDLKGLASWLASDPLAGRRTGTDGAKLASEGIADALAKAGLQPLPGQESMFLPFEFNAGERLIADKNKLALTLPAGAKAPALEIDRHFRPLAFSENGEAEGEVVFAGYGLNVPEAPGQRSYNSYEGLDVKDKVVLLLRYVPEGVEPARRAHLNRYAGLRYKAMMARERGAKAVLIVTGPNSPNAGELIPLSSDGSASGSGILTASITAEVADALLASKGKTLKDLQSQLDLENPHVEATFPLPGVRAKLSCGVEHIKRPDRNVAAVIPPGEKSAKPEYILVGAHYDHLGLGDGSSLAGSTEKNKIHYGADDNASGTAVVLELAAALAKERAANPAKFRRGIIFGFWSGEEMGILGSAAFAEKPPVPLDQVAAYVNFDMVGRLRDNKLVLQGIGSSKTWPKLIEKRNVAAGFALTLQDDPYLPTDVTAFYPKRIPVLNFFTGSHEDYHRPSDTPDKLNIEGMERIAKFARGIVTDLASAAERPDFSRIERKESTGGSRDNLRAYLGTIPDYAQEVKGVKLSGVRAGSPAEKAGIKGGDVIVEFGGQKIANIYDYTYALDAVKIGKDIKIVVERDGKRIEVTATPTARQ